MPVGSSPNVDLRSLESGATGGGGSKQPKVEKKGSFKSEVTKKLSSYNLHEEDGAPKTRAHGRRGSINMMGGFAPHSNTGVTKEQVEVIMETQNLILEQLAAINAHLGILGAESSPLAKRVTYKRETSEFFDKDEDE